MKKWTMKDLEGKKADLEEAYVEKLIEDYERKRNRTSIISLLVDCMIMAVVYFGILLAVYLIKRYVRV